MSDVWVARINRYVEKLFNVKGGPTVVDISPGISIEQPLFSGVEDRYLQGWNRFAIAQSVTGGAVANAASELHNPLGSNMVAVVESVLVRINPATASLFVLSLTPGPATIADFIPVTALRIDGRTTSNSTCIFSTSTAGVGFANAIRFGSVNANSSFEFITYPDEQINLMPGSALIAVDNTVNEIASFSWIWRERPIETSESS